jgi:hypothetical protein
MLANESQDTCYTQGYPVSLGESERVVAAPVVFPLRVVMSERRSRVRGLV